MATSPNNVGSTSAPQAQVDLERTDFVIEGVFEPPSGLVLNAIRRNKLLIAACALIFALLGTVYGLSRHRTYTASATLQVGQVNPNSPGFYSYVQSASALATAFSRAITAEPVLLAVQQQLKLPLAQAAARLSATPVIQSPALQVTASGPSESAAIKLANVGAGALITYEGQTNSANPQAESLLQEFRKASLDLRNIEAHIKDLGNKLNHERHVPRNALAPEEATRNAAEIKQKALGVAYTAAVSSQAPRSGLVTLLAGATSASSDHKAKVEQLGFIGLLIGVVVGCIVATLRERRRARPLDPGGGVRAGRAMRGHETV